MKKLKVAILFGGKSGEHEVSLQSARSIYETLNKHKYDVILVGIDKEGVWRLESPANYLINAADPGRVKLNKSAPAITAIQGRRGAQLVNISSSKTLATIDVFFPITHGTFGEDGCLQGFLELLGAAYVCAGVLGSAVGMDKDIMKRLLRDARIPIAKFVSFNKGKITREHLRAAVVLLKFPIFVKPANLGSSVGISKAKTFPELVRAVALAFRYDTKILLEEFVPGREIECSVLGNDNPIASLPGEVSPTHEFYSYEAKYIDEKGATLSIPAKMPRRVISAVRALAIKTFEALECSGLARVDFFLTPRGKIVVNEINTLPGFTKISMYPKLWEASGIPFLELLDRLIKLAIARKRQVSCLKRDYAPR